MSTINHEVLHVALCMCLDNASGPEIERMVEKLTGTQLTINEATGEMGLRKV